MTRVGMYEIHKRETGMYALHTVQGDFVACYYTAKAAMEAGIRLTAEAYQRAAMIEEQQSECAHEHHTVIKGEAYCPTCRKAWRVTDADAPRTFHVQPMTGVVHRDPTCSMGTARYGTVPCTLPDEAVHVLVLAGRMKACKRCAQ